MTKVLDENPTKFQVVIGARIIGEATTRSAADLIISRLSESEQAQAVVVPIVSNGNQVLLG